MFDIKRELLARMVSPVIVLVDMKNLFQMEPSGVPVNIDPRIILTPPVIINSRKITCPVIIR